ncbi:UNVERIFIED_CONTAM: hypothetical protein RMT77_006267 [Armadillidium vulgare]
MTWKKYTLLIAVLTSLLCFLTYYRINDLNPINLWMNSETADKNLVSSTQSEEDDYNECEIPPLTDLEDFFDYGKREKYQCENLKEIGGNKRINDGSKFVCLDEKFQIVRNDCIVLSFGISYEWSFDDGMYNLGCTVYAFDPTMGTDDFDRKPKMHFYNLGLSNFKGMKKLTKGKTKFKVDRYENILLKLNLTEKKIDYLKIDIEGSEMDFFDDVLTNSSHLLKNVKQIGVEIHSGRIPKGVINEETIKNGIFYRLWREMHQLECNNFQLLHYEQNRVKGNHFKFRNRTESTCYEIVWVNVGS